jgi:hypothetical protein
VKRIDFVLGNKPELKRDATIERHCPDEYSGIGRIKEECDADCEACWNKEMSTDDKQGEDGGSQG